jgi:hypothetical protein
VLHAGKAFPEAAREHTAPQFVEQSHVLRLQRHNALEVRQVPSLIAAATKGGHAGLALGEQRG